MIYGRPATWHDLEKGLSIQPKNGGDALVGREASLNVWKQLFQSPFFASLAISASTPIRGESLIGLGASVFVSSSFVNKELAYPQADLNSRIVASVHEGKPATLNWKQVAHANANGGIDVVVLQGSCWRHEILDKAQNERVRHILPPAFTEWHAGYRLNRILCETADTNARDHLRDSIVYETVAEYPEQGRMLHMMTRASADRVPGSLANALFSYNKPLFRLRSSDQEMLLAAMNGATDQELASRLALTLAAVKARWRSVIARMEDGFPDVMNSLDAVGRGTQKRHRVLAYVRSHQEELRPYEW